jgi:hypothetical protein
VQGRGGVEGFHPGTTIADGHQRFFEILGIGVENKGKIIFKTPN